MGTGPDVEDKGIELESYEARENLVLSITRPPSILFVSCIYGLAPIIRYLLPRKGIYWNQSKSHETNWWNPLGLSAERGYTDVVQTLLDQQPGFYVKGARGDKAGAHALAGAVYGSHFTTAKLLLESGVDRNERDGRSSIFSMKTPLSIACLRGDEAMVELLLSHNVDPNISRINMNEPRRIFELTPLYDACSEYYYGITKLLLEAGADVESTVSGNILHNASKYGDESLVRTLLARGVDVHAPECGRMSFEKRTPLHNAADYGHAGVIKLLVLHGVNIDAKDYRDKKAIYYAAKRNSAAAVEAFIALGVDPCEKDAWGKTILHTAAKYGSEDVVRFLTTKGVDIKGHDANRWTALHFAANTWHENKACLVIQFLLDQGASIDAKDSKGRTPLSIAAEKCYYRMLELLVGRDADITSRDCNGWTPLHFAKDRL
jgi:ankyrin repeat protein